MNECDYEVCGNDALNCENNDGGYTCECPDNFYFDPTVYGSGCIGLYISTVKHNPRTPVDCLFKKIDLKQLASGSSWLWLIEASLGEGKGETGRAAGGGGFQDCSIKHGLNSDHSGFAIIKSLAEILAR